MKQGRIIESNEFHCSNKRFIMEKFIIKNPNKNDYEICLIKLASLDVDPPRLMLFNRDFERFNRFRLILLLILLIGEVGLADLPFSDVRLPGDVAFLDFRDKDVLLPGEVAFVDLPNIDVLLPTRPDLLTWFTSYFYGRFG
ncbi:hypothetical protein DERP_011171 [Dermatophagoides pteronyssinus]|uniref:Uncharacterized protein n=1 Tax=Dermatophagoides pteronyssinus TaxID=6956 RepID=A0ABQ8JCD4_DERPT|nr:hypothetical protein DERP_011171 [Dermatophagoides pteronyssinus]